MKIEIMAANRNFAAAFYATMSVMIAASQEQESRGVVYLARCLVTGKCYIGQAVNYKRRKKAHLRQAKGGYGACKAFHAALRKHGAKNFRWRIIARPLSSELVAVEARMIAERKTVSPYGYNLRDDGVAGKFSEEVIAHMCETRRGVKRKPEAVAATAAWHRGKKRPQEWCDNISKARKGQPCKPSARKKISATLTGRPGRKHTKKAKAKMRVRALEREAKKRAAREV